MLSGGAPGRRGGCWGGRGGLRDRCCGRLCSGGRAGDSGDLRVWGRDLGKFLGRTRLLCRYRVLSLLDVDSILFPDYHMNSR
jgi:hypothetical protein